LTRCACEQGVAILLRVVRARHSHDHCGRQHQRRERTRGQELDLHALLHSSGRFAVMPASVTANDIIMVIANSTGRSRFMAAFHANWPSPGTLKMTSTGTSALSAVTIEREANAA